MMALALLGELVLLLVVGQSRHVDVRWRDGPLANPTPSPSPSTRGVTLPVPWPCPCPRPGPM